MKKVVALFVMLFGASVSMFAHADMSQGSSGSSAPQATQPQSGDQSGGSATQPGGTTDTNSSSGSSSSNGSSSSSSSSEESDDTAS